MAPTVSAARLDAGEDYASYEAILACDDRVETTIKVPGWSRDGKALALRVRQLDLIQMEDIRMRSARAVAPEDRARGVQIHWPTRVAAVFAAGVISPAMSFEQATALLTKNMATMEAVADYITTMSKLDKDAMERAIAALAAADSLPLEPDAGDVQP